ncbi:hypothetical protein TELCIR_03266 [Teladorsagia circumcincta]|uniref:25S rRNA (uridine-N(3))-methyltransferase BMT5-like domain-containing protein n=1 Tax=Teladorsagia circumcincta TaxID=45464 RepID=A0A2G9UX06_TELCI|nr:hypothetical protein TELCIR_03266 [Teladorsagia circumcincta]
MKADGKRWFEEARSLLILGDGNLSFSRAVAESETNLPITATVLDSEAEFLTRYGHDRNIQRLRECDNVQLLFGVDATALPSEWAGKFHYIAMNFPHPGGKTNLRKSRLLASGIFRSVSSIMTDDSEFHLVLAQGQAGVQYNGGSPWSSSAPIHEKDTGSDENVDEGERLAFELLRQLTGSAVVEVREVKELRSMCPNPYLPNRIYRLTWQDVEVAVGKRACNKLQEELREKIQATIKERNLPLILT